MVNLLLIMKNVLVVIHVRETVLMELFHLMKTIMPILIMISVLVVADVLVHVTMMRYIMKMIQLLRNLIRRLLNIPRLLLMVGHHSISIW